MSEYTDSVESGLKGLTAVSTGFCPGCAECADLYGFESVEAARKQYETGSICDEPHFSWNSCGICGSQLGGDREVWHGLNDLTGTLYHFNDACEDCVVYLANGDEPGE